VSNGRQKERKSIKRPVAIAVEGLDYLYFLLSQLDGPLEFEGIQLWNFMDVGLVRWLEGFRKMGGFETIRGLGIIRDAEGNSVNTIASVRAALANSGYPAPDGPMQVEIEGGLAVGYLVMPHGANAGCLEDACLPAVKAGSPMDCVEAFARCVDKPEKNNNWRAKVKVHSIIAASDQPYLTLGESAKSNIWDFANPSLSVMLSFIRQVRDAH
jgi:hypothetical protein